MKNRLQLTMLLFSFILFGITSKAQNALNFDGVDDYVNLNGLSSQISDFDPFTVEFTMKTSEASSQALFAINGQSLDWSTQHAYVLLVSTSGDLELWIGGVTGDNISKYYANDFISDNNCHHIAMTVSTQIVTVYIDGVSKIIATPHPHPLNSSHLYSLGQEWDGWAWWSNYVGQPTQFYNGDLDEVRVWSTARSQSQIYDNKDLQLTGNEPNLIALYNCNQGIPSGYNVALTTLTNGTSNTGLDGVLNNFSMNGNGSNFVRDYCVLDCEALGNHLFTQITSDLTITTNTVWSGKYYIGDGVTITVENNANLDLTNVDLVFGSCAGMDFINGGTLRANNSVFRSCSIYGTWKGMYFEGINNTESNNLINECTFKNAEEALSFDKKSDALISNNLFSNCFVGIKTLNTNFHHTISGNMFVTEELYPEFSSCTDKKSITSYSIYADHTNFSEPISQNEFINSNEDITAVGFESSFGGGKLTNNTFTDLNHAVNIISASFNFNIGSNQIIKNTIEGHGIYVYNSHNSLIEINDNILTNHKYGNITENGIYLDRVSYVSVSNNQIEGYNTGIYAHNSTNLQIINNMITNARNFGIAYVSNIYFAGTTNYITCNEITMFNFNGSGIYIQNMTTNSLIATNCIFDSKLAIDLLNTTSNGLLPMPKIRNNYLYNYTDIGINVDNYGGNIGTINASDQGMNTFWSNTFNSSVDIQSSNPINTAYNFGLTNISPQVTIDAEKQYYSTASCSNQIEYKTTGVESLLIEEYQCDNISLIVDMIGNGNPGGSGESSFIDNSISKLAESTNQFMLSRVIIGHFDNLNEQQLNQIISQTDLSINEELLLEYQYYYKKRDYVNAKLAISNFSPIDDREFDLKTICLIDLKTIEFGWSSIATQEKEALNQIILKKSEFSNISISLNNHISDYMPYQVSVVNARNVEVSSEPTKLKSGEETLSIYPSPTNSMVTVDIINLNENDEVLIYDISGKVVMNYSISFSTGKLQVNIEDFEKGVYFVTINDSKSGTTKKGKFVKI
jgi:parallel beta-helix repeat protein